MTTMGEFIAPFSFVIGFAFWMSSKLVVTFGCDVEMRCKQSRLGA